MKKILDLKVVIKKWITSTDFLLQLKAEEKLPEIKPGQFAEILVDNSNDVFLRRPFSIHDFDYKNQTVDFLIQIKGKGTQQLSNKEKGDIINVMLPLGNSFTVSESDNYVLLVGGGCGVAPLMSLAKTINQKSNKVHILIGAKTKKALLRVDEYKKYGNIFCTTEDGSFGEKGFVTEHSLMNNIRTYEMIYVCGPEPMMKAVAKIAKKNQIECEVSLENTMACGIGACLCCVTETVDGNMCTCTDGPIFNVNKLKWQI
ncbi:MAG: dihydroorotate dehydrogenase electron transfer subunit [Marinilabiliales bacterium]